MTVAVTESHTTSMRLPQRLGWLLKRLASSLYDALILIAVFMVATALIVMVRHAAVSPPPPYNLAFDACLLGIAFAYFGLFWTKGGQTTGMRAWHLRVVGENGREIGWRRAITRFLAAMLSWLCLGLGWLWILFDKEGRAFHDVISRSRVIKAPKNRIED